MLSDCDIGVVLLVGIPVIILNKTVRQWSNGGSNGAECHDLERPSSGWRLEILILLVRRGQEGYK